MQSTAASDCLQNQHCQDHRPMNNNIFNRSMVKTDSQEQELESN